MREKYVKQAPTLFKDKDASKLEKFQEETKKQGLQAVEKVLKPEQFRRLKQLCIQQRSYKVFADKDVQVALKLTDGQLRQLPMLLGERDKTLKNLKSFTPLDIERIDRETTAAHVNILTPEQKKQWEELNRSTISRQTNGERRFSALRTQNPQLYGTRMHSMSCTCSPNGRFSLSLCWGAI